MTSSKISLSSGSKLPYKSKNKERQRSFHLREKKAKESVKRDERFRRKREEDEDPLQRVDRRTRNIPATLDRKRVWDELDDEEGDGIGLSVDVERVKRPKTELEQSRQTDGLTDAKLNQVGEVGCKLDDLEDRDGEDDAYESQLEEDDLASLLNESDGGDHLEEDDRTINRTPDASAMPPPPVPNRATSPTASTTSTNLSLIPEALAAKFPTLFKPPESPKILITTSLNGTVHNEASLLTTLFPNSNYVPRTRHRYNAHHFSLREIATFASNRQYTTLIVVNEDQKRPSGLTVIHLPAGPTFHFSINSWIEGKKLPGHGNPTNHYPELILNNFRTPLGLLTAHLFRTMFPPQPELQGRQVVTLHNQRDYIFVRRHRYVFRDKRPTEKAIVGTDGKSITGVEEIRAGLQELGPRFTLKLRRVDRCIQRASGQEWEWKAGMEKERTKFQL